ncbi:MAG: hypothetical protein ACTSWN_10170 [Promethearchaeota archaeon]
MVMSDELKDLIRKLIIMVSESRKQENERYENHVKFMSDLTEQIESFSQLLNERWDRLEIQMKDIQESLRESVGKLQALFTMIDTS